MSDLISRQAAIDALEREKTYCTAYKDGYIQRDYFKQYNMGLTDGIKALNKLPSAGVTLCHLDSPCEYQNADIAMPTAERVGRWNAKPSRWCVSDIVFECSECGCKSDLPTYYCPYCGSRNERMRGEEDE